MSLCLLSLDEVLSKNRTVVGRDSIDVERRKCMEYKIKV